MVYLLRMGAANQDAEPAIELRGIGFPGGVVTAEVGTQYVDEDATNGAVRWVKTHGSDSVGWQVIEGDTGNLDITPLMPDSVQQACPGLELRVQRQGDTVRYSIWEYAPGNFSGDMPLLPSLLAGFGSPRVRAGHPVMESVGTPHCGPEFTTWLRVDATRGVKMLGAIAGARHVGSVEFPTNDPWPVTLPGTTGTRRRRRNPERPPGQ